MPLGPKNVIEEILRQRPNIPDDQLLEEAKRVFSQYKGVKVGATVTKEDLDKFRKTWVKASGYTPEDAILSVRVSNPNLSDAELVAEANNVYQTYKGPKSALRVTKKDLAEYGSNMVWFNSTPPIPTIPPRFTAPKAESLRKKYLVIG